MQAYPSSGFPVPGRRRVTTLSKEEWREALEQQRREKEALQRKPRHEPDNQAHDTHDASVTTPSTVENADVVANNRSGRRFVAAMSAEEWRASLAQQIREKEMQREKQKRGYTAPEHVVSSSEEVDTMPEAARSQSAAVAPSCLPALADDAAALAGRRRRGGAPQQSREEYLRSLQEQIELKKKREEAEGATHFGRGKLGRRRVIGDDDGGGGFWPPLPAAASVSKPPPATTTTTESVVNVSIAAEDNQDLIDAGDGVAGGSDKPSAEQPGVSAPIAEVASAPAVVMDPAALSKLFELCEGMKQQNEELKQQLRDQQFVLASLASATTTTTTTDSTAAKSVSKVGKAVAKKSSKPEAEPKTRDKKPPKKNTTNATAMKTVTAKAEPKQPALLIRKKLSGQVPRQASTPTKSTSTRISNHDGKSSDATPSAEPTFVNSALEQNYAKPSRLPQPRVVPRLRSAQALAAKTNGALEVQLAAPTEAPAPNDSTTSEPKLPIEVDTPHAVDTPSPCPETIDAAVDELMPQHDQADFEGEFPSTSVEMIAPEPALEPEHAFPSLLRLVPSPPIRRKSVPTKKSTPCERVSLPLLATRSSFSLAADNCLDRTASSTSTRVSSSLYRLHVLDDGALDAQCSSISMLDGHSNMISCGSTQLPF